MRPLNPIALGLLVVALTATISGYDVLPDPLGWLLVLAGVLALPPAVPRLRALRWLTVLAGVVAVPLWVPGVTDRLSDTDPALVWAASLPQLAVTLLLADGLARTAAAADDTRAARWFATTAVLVLVVAVLPVLVFGAGLDGLEEASYGLASLVLIALIVLIGVHASRPWAAGVPRSGPVARSGGSA